MSKIALEGNASGTGTFTIASPNSNSNYTLTLPSSTGTVVVTGGAQTIEFAAGTAAAPSITFTGDTNTGIFSPAADTIAFTEGGAEAMRIDSSGQLLLNTTSALTNVYFEASNITPTTQFITNQTASYSGGLALINYSAGGFGSVLTIGSSRSDTKGTNTTTSNGTPVAQLNFVGNDGTNFRTTAAIKVAIDGVSGSGDMPGRLEFYTTADGAATATERMRIDSSGNVGIGTSSPIAKLDTATTSDNNLNIIRYAESTSGAVFRIRHSYSNTIGTNTLLPGSGGGYQFGRIEFVGATGTDYAVGASIVGIALGSTSSTSMPGVLIFNTTPESSTSPTERARITSGGYFKASNSGSYFSSTGSYHEFYQTANTTNIVATVSNASFTGESVEINANKSANSDYTLLTLWSGNFTDREFRFRGDGNGYADGTFNNNGADYAEFFESANGQALTLGATVVLDGNKVREATSQDPASAIIGVVRPKEPSKASMVVGNTAWNKWANKYLTDDFDRYIMENHDVVEWEEQVLERDAVSAVEAVVDEEGNEVSPAVSAQEAVYKTKQHSYESHNIPAGITVPADAVRKTHDDKGNKFQHYKLNPAWDKDAEYVNRENRPEWNIIGLLGQVKILKGQPVGDRWIKMRDVSATVEEWMIR